jgi:MSHA pilin protein MshD
MSVEGSGKWQVASGKEGPLRRRLSFPLPNSPFPLQGGFTLIELIISIVVIGAAVGGVMLLVANVAARSVDPMIQTQAVYIAQSYLEEALLRPYDGSADCAGSRDQWQGVLAYDCINTETPTDQQGNGLPGLSAYRVSMNVADAALGGVAARRVEVQVTHMSQPIDLRIAGYRANY